MNGSPRSPGRRNGLAKAMLSVACWTFAATLVAWCGCTVTRENYPTLSFFFDGVPDPDAPGPGGSAPGDTMIAAAVIVHRPFGEEKCEACHKTQYRPGRNDPSACLTCHPGVIDKYAWTHGAVVGGACLWCHAPHESARKWLLRGPDRNLCVQCHAATAMNGSAVPAHADPKASCLECHFAHGGENSLMLKPGAGVEAPPRPAEAPPGDPQPATPPAPPGAGGATASLPSTLHPRPRGLR